MPYFNNVSPSDPDVTLPIWSSTDHLQMAGDFTRLNIEEFRAPPQVGRRRQCTEFSLTDFADDLWR